jgi:hypothetical protein
MSNATETTAPAPATETATAKPSINWGSVATNTAVTGGVVVGGVIATGVVYGLVARVAVATYDLLS